VATRLFEERVDYSLTAWGLFEVRSVFERRVFCEGYVYSDLEFLDEVRMMREYLNQIRILLATKGIEG